MVSFHEMHGIYYELQATLSVSVYYSIVSPLTIHIFFSYIKSSLILTFILTNLFLQNQTQYTPLSTDANPDRKCTLKESEKDNYCKKLVWFLCNLFYDEYVCGENLENVREAH